jgi:L-Lysine epsilon oxidase N-terminal/L-lysine epsilon oxidase C-terminal domain
MPRYQIFPAIGIARVGGDDDFFIGPEIPEQGPIEAATGAAVTRFKSADKKSVRKQAARFHLFESADGTNWVPVNLPNGATIEWTVTLENKKSAVTRTAEPSISPQRPVLDPALAGMHIKPASSTITGANAMSAPIQGGFTTTDTGGAPFNATVTLGRLRTDSAGRLIVLGGDGSSDAPSGTPIGGPGGTTYYRNPKWYDDVADGPVTAKIRLAPGDAPIEAEGGAWVIVGPPDYAPGIGGVVTLYDVIRQVGIDSGLPAPAAAPSFDLDIAPMIRRAKRHRWVHTAANWSSAQFDDPNLRSKSPAHATLRGQVRDRIKRAEVLLTGHTSPAGPPFKLRQYQVNALQAWVAGDFDDAPASFGSVPTADGLTRAALEGAVGQGFCPGIEAGILVLDRTIYRTPFDFRIDHASVSPGDLTALMAQPWQADFLKCHPEWWPAQRPDVAAQSDDFNDTEEWIRGANDHALLVKNFERLGFIVQQGANEVFIEAERDASL